MSGGAESKIDGGWFLDLIETFKPDNPTPDGTPEEMTKHSGWRAFQISTAAAIPPGPLGLLTILPELAAVTKLQINLIHKTAVYYGKETILRENPRLIMLILGNAVGVSIGKSLVNEFGGRIVLRAIESTTMKKIAARIGQGIAGKILARMTSKSFLRFVPIVLAPVFGHISRKMTIKIGKEADRIFHGEIVVERTKRCSKGHEAQPETKFCPECGEPFGEETG